MGIRHGTMLMMAGVVLAMASAQAPAALFSFEAAEAIPSKSFNFNDSTGILTGATDVPLTIQITGVNTTVDSDLAFSATRVGVESYFPPVGSSIDVWIFDGSFQFTTPGGVLILSADFTGARTMTMDGSPLSGIQAASNGTSTLTYTPGPVFEQIAGNVLGFDPNDPLILLALIDPQSMGFTLTGVLPLDGIDSGFDADSSFSGNAEIAVTVIPEPATLALLGMGALMVIGRKSRRAKRTA